MKIYQSILPLAAAALFLNGQYSSAQDPVYGGLCVGGNHNLAFLTNGLVTSSGRNNAYQLGNPNTTNRAYFALIPGLSNVVALEGGDTHSLALCADGSVFSFGDGTYGKLGLGDANDRTSPTLNTNLSGVSAIAAGGSHSLALSNSYVLSWGYGASGRLGTSSTTTALRPVCITNLPNVTAIAAGDMHSVAISNGYVWAFGSGASGRLGYGGTTNQTSPVQMTGISNAVAVAAGGAFSLILRDDQTVVACGLNSSGQLGDSTTSQRTTPVQTTNLYGVVAIAAGDKHALALLTNGLVRAWGANGSGQLGDSSTVNRKTNVAVVGISNVVAIAAGDTHSVALTSDGKIYAWGSRAYGQLSDLSTNSYSTNPVPTFTAIQIENQPQNQTVIFGNTANFGVGAIGTTPLGYQWHLNGTSLAAATNSALAIENAQPVDEGSYTVVLTNAPGSATSGIATLTVLVPAAIFTQPTNQTVVQGSNATFNVSATGTSPLSYQWRFNGTNLAGATAATYTRQNVQPAHAGSYSVVVTNVAGSDTSSNAVLTVLVPPSIQTQPQGQTVIEGSNATLTVQASGTTPLSYQWRFNGTNLAGATADSLALTNVELVQAGSYSVQVTNVVGSTISSNALLIVLQRLTNLLINVDFAANPARTNKTGFAAVGQSTADIWNEHWAPGGYSFSLTNLQGADGANTGVGLTVDNAPGAWGLGSPDPMYNDYAYANGGGDVNITVTDLPAGNYDLYLYAYDGNYQVTVGGSGYYSAPGSGSFLQSSLTQTSFPATNSPEGNAASSLENNQGTYLLEGGTVYDAQTNLDWPIENPPLWREGRQYSRFRDVRVASGQPLTVTARVGAHDPSALIAGMQLVQTAIAPVITDQPQSQAVAQGSNATFTVTATGTLPLSYQWQFNYTDIPGATTNSYTRQNAQPSDAGLYTVVVTNVAGSDTSTEAELTVIVPPTITRQPISQTAFWGTPVAFSVSATGTSPFTYQWRCNGTNLPGETNVLLLLTTAPGTEAIYSVTLANAASTVTSSNAALTCYKWDFPPPLPEGDVLDHWPFDDTNWLTARHRAPLVATNLDCVASWDTNAVQLDTTNAALLQYPLVWTNGFGRVSTKLLCDRGSLEFWFKPNWSGTNASGTGPGTAARLIEVGQWTTNASNSWWSLYLNPEGTMLTFSAQADGISTNYLAATVTWLSNEWYHVALTYSATNSALYLDGQLAASGSGVTVLPSEAVRADGFRIGSDSTGLLQARGQFENLWTYDYPLPDHEVAFNFAADWPQVAGWASGEGSQRMSSGQMILTEGPTGLDGPQGAQPSGVYLTNMTCTLDTNAGWTATFRIEGGAEGVLYHLYSGTNLASGLTNAAWQWLRFVQNSETVSLTNQSAARAFYMIGPEKDTDGDGMPDWWEVTNGFNPNNPNDANNDPDNDGLTNLQEYHLGTNPNVDQSAQTSGRINYQYNGNGWLRVVSGIWGESITIDAEGNVQQVSP